MNKFKAASFLVTVILIPFIVSIIANYTTWFSTKPKAEITFTLDGWITIGSVDESDLVDLKLIYKDKPINNFLKTSWRVSNTGTEGIDAFERGPTIHYPSSLTPQEAKVSSTSAMLKLDKNVNIDTKNKSIGFNNLGIFNPGDYFVTDIYFADIPNDPLSPISSGEWGLSAKALNLIVNTDILVKIPDELQLPRMVYYFIGVLGALLANFLSSVLYRRKKDKRKIGSREE